MFHIAPQAIARLSPEALLVAELFLGSLPPSLRRTVRSVQLYGRQAARFEPGLPFEVLVVADERSLALKSAVSIASAAVESEAAQSVFVTVVGAADLAAPPEHLERAVQNAGREGIALWERPVSS